MSKQATASPKIANFFGGLGYLSIIMQWMWSLALLVPALLENDSLKTLLLPDAPSERDTQIIQVSGDSILMIVIAVAVTIIVLAVTLVILIRLPITLVRASRKTFDTAVEAALPVVSHHKKITKKRQRALSIRIKRILKLLAVLIPLTPFTFSSFIDFGLDTSIALFVATAFALVSIIWFAMQYGLAKLQKLNESDLL